MFIIRLFSDYQCVKLVITSKSRAVPMLKDVSHFPSALLFTAVHTVSLLLRCFCTVIESKRSFLPRHSHSLNNKIRTWSASRSNTESLRNASHLEDFSFACQMAKAICLTNAQIYNNVLLYPDNYIIYYKLLFLYWREKYHFRKRILLPYLKHTIDL